MNSFKRYWFFSGANKMSVCERYTKIAYTVTGHKTALVTRLRCKQWTCEFCAKKNAGMWQYWLIKRLPEVSNEWFLITLTAHEKTRTSLASLENLRNGIDALIKRMKRVWGDDIEYVRVFEKHPTSQAIHVHIVMTGITPYVVNGCSEKLRPMAIGVKTREGRSGTWSLTSWLKINARALKMGYMAHSKRLEGSPEQAAFYVTKYLTKDMQAIDIPYLRHVQVTKGIGSPQFEASYKWTPASYITANTFDEPNTRITDLDTGEVIDNNYWEVKSHYPYD